MTHLTDTEIALDLEMIFLDEADYDDDVHERCHGTSEDDPRLHALCRIPLNPEDAIASWVKANCAECIAVTKRRKSYMPKCDTCMPFYRPNNRETP